MSKAKKMLGYCKKYLNLSYPEKMSTFCRAESIDYEKFRRFKRQYLRKYVEQVGFSPVIITPDKSLYNGATPISTESQECKVHDFSISYHNGVILKVSMADVSTVSALINISVL